MRQKKKTLIMLTLSGGGDGRRVMTKMLVMVFEQLSKALVEIFECFMCFIGNLQLLKLCHIESVGRIFIGNTQLLLKCDYLCVQREVFLVAQLLFDT